ncbi:MAG TPA: BREX system ATP-binding domain-containing protein, partial [Thermomicrobiales bacterium]|nr:BREX system ATP-binding domain-containing protein [Thermomicrobiales bacterium]
MGVVKRSLDSQISDSLLVGRDNDQRLLRMQLDRAVGGQGSFVLISGEAGIGKTTLVAALSREAQAREVHVAIGHCYDRSATPPYGPWGELTTSQRTDLVPQLRVASPADPVFADQHVLFNQVTDAVSAVAAKRPIVVVLEDMHWSDPASLELLRHVARHPSTIPLLLIVTYRSDEVIDTHPLYALLPILVRESDAVRIELQRLGRPALAGLIAGQYLLPQTDHERLVNYVTARSEGNPLFAHELLRMLEQRGTLRQIDADWQFGDIRRMQVP